MSTGLLTSRSNSALPTTPQRWWPTARPLRSSGAYAQALLAVPLPWTRMRRVYARLGLVQRYGAARVEALCPLDADLLDVTRLRRMLATTVALMRLASGTTIGARGEGSPGWRGTTIYSR